MTATRTDWNITPLPALRASIMFDRTYTAEEFEQLRQGNVPEEMEDKWFAFYEAPWFYLHRSWTGFGIYQARFEPSDGGFRIVEVLVNRDPDQYTNEDTPADGLLLAALLDGYAGRDAESAWEQYFAATENDE